jgi:nicotinamidase-related amidase
MLLVIDLQGRLMPAIHEGAVVVAQARRLVAAAGLLDVPMLFTEQHPRALGVTVAEFAVQPAQVLAKMTFDAVRAPGFGDRVADDRDLVIAGCEAHVCVLQTVLGLLGRGRRVYVVRDAIGSRVPASKEAAIDRMARHGAEVVTTEMVVFEWLGSAEHPRFREALALVK